MSQEQAEFQLNSVERLARLQWEGARTHSQLLNEQLDRLQKAVAIEKDKTKLQQLQHQCRTLDLERRRCMAKERSLQHYLARVQRAIKRACNLWLGEAISESATSRAWVGFFFLLREYNRGPLDVGDVERSDEYWSPREQKVVDNPIGPITSTLNWARKNNYVPRFGTASYKALGKFLTDMNASADQSAEILTQQLSAAKERLDQLRKEGKELT